MKMSFKYISLFISLLLCSTILKASDIDTSKDVGSIPFSYNQTPSGALTYAVPIEVYSGNISLNTQVALSYNSQDLSQFYTVGYKWSVSGLSEIRRSQLSNYYNNIFSSVPIKDNLHSFVLDGLHLQASDNSSYNFQSEQGNIYVKSNAAYTQFEVYYPDGSVGYYGDGSHKYIFPIIKKTDRLGNSVNYTYSLEDNRYYILSISYNTNENLKVGEIKFSYVDNSFENTHYIYGTLLKTTKKVSKIDSYHLNNLQKSYILNHSLAGNNYILNKIDCTSSSGNYLNPLTFEYNSTPNINIQQNRVTITNEYNNTRYPAEDYVKMRPRHKVVNWDTRSDNEGYVLIPRQRLDEDDKLIFHASDKLIFIDPKGRSSYYYLQNDFHSLISGDIDGDGNEEALKINDNNEDKNSISITRYKYNKAARSFSTKTFSIGTQIGNNRFYLCGDFRGQGKSELMIISCGKNNKGEPRNTGVTFINCETETVAHSNPDYFSIQPEDYLDLIDFDGDGSVELLHINDKQASVRKVSPTGSFPLLATLPINLTTIKNNRLLTGDLNNDGKTDILLPPGITVSNKQYVHSGACAGCCSLMATSPEEVAMNGEFPVEMQCGPTKKCIISDVEDVIESDGGTEWTIYYSNGKDAFDTSKFTHNRRILFEYDSYIFSDINNDGWLDLVRTKANVSGDKLFFYLNKQGSFSIDHDYSNRNGGGEIINTRGSNRFSHNKGLAIINDSIASIFYDQNQQASPNSLVRATSSLGATTEFTYAKIGNDSVYSSNTTTLQYPWAYVPGFVSLLQSLKSSVNGSIVESQEFKYNTGIFHYQGLGFRGFEKITKTDHIKDMTVVQEFDPQNFGILKSEDSPFGKATYDYSIDVNNKKIASILLTKKEETDKLKGITVKSSYQYDSYGNPIEEKIDYGDGIISTTLSKLSNIDTGTTYLLGRLDEQSIKNTRGNSSVISKTVISYNDKHLPVSKTAYYNNNKTSEEAYVYYQNMDLKESKAKAYSSKNWLITQYEYDTQGRISRKTDPYGFYVDYTYNSKGQVQSEKNYLGHITSYTYDSWGRNTQTNYTDGSIETNTLEWAKSPAGALYVAKSTMTGQPDAEVYYDALGREIRKGSKRFDGKYLYTDYVYDNKGRVQKTSLPFKGSTPGLWNTYNYDQYDRITSLSYASGKKDIYSYDKLQTTSVIDSVSLTKTEDATGKVMKIKDDAGIIAYGYRPDGQVRSIIAPGNIKTSFVYDKYGRQIMIKDPSAGNRSYEYDDAGNTVKETDADGKTIRMQYDTYNRLISKEISDGFTSTYTYDNNSLLTGISSTNGTSKSFEYDNLLRLLKEKETIVDNRYLEKSYTYSGNTLSSVSYASQSGNIVTENYVYTNGHHTETKLNGSTSVWKLTEENSLGMPTASVTGELNRTYSYDTYGMPTGRGIKKGSTTIQNFGYKFNSMTGNLDWRKDHTRNITENFGYDHLNRLTHFNNHIIAYNKRGNITDHSGVGYFGYSSVKPYAIEGVSPYNETIPMRDQHIRYNAQMRPDSISEGDYSAALLYDTDGNRIKMHLKKGGNDELIRYYIAGQYEMEHTLAGVEERLYLDGDAYSAAAVYVKKGSNPWQVQYIGRDYLGSITHITDAAGNLKEEYSYDPWGRLRNPQDHTLYKTDEAPVLLLSRGYTGHEHLSMFGLINMNARLYDPAVGRFLSPDPYVQAPFMSQNFNRYSYALNNPLRYTDPSGEWFIIDDFTTFIIGGIINLGVNIWQGNINGSFWEQLGEGAMAFVAGGAAGTMALYGPAGWAAGGALTGLTNSYLSGENIWQGMAIGGVAGLAGGYAGNVAADRVGSMVVNGFKIQSPIVKGAVGGAIGGSAGGYVGGFTSGLIMTGDINQAHEAGTNGIIWGGSIGTVAGGVAGYKYAKDNGISPWKGEAILEINNNYNFTADPYGDNVKLYRGMTGFEGENRALWMTTDADYAATYAKTGTVVEIIMPRSALFQMQQNNMLIQHNGINQFTSTPYTEYMFTQPAASQILKNYNFIP